MSKKPSERRRRARAAARATDWQVIAVFDPDGTGQDFGYTVGLADLGHPELHMWARPTDGTDPGHDFKLSSRDIGQRLNHYAQLLLAGDLDVGSEHEVEFDGGLTSATFTVGDPVTPDEVDAFQVHPGSDVMPLRWELHREPEGERLPVADDVVASIESLARDWRELCAGLGANPVLGTPRIRSGERFGPWSPVIEAVRDAVRVVGSQGYLSWCIDDLGDHRDEIGHHMAVAAALARRHGRSTYFDEAARTGIADGEHAIGPYDSIFVGVTRSETDRLLPHARAALSGILGPCYGLLAVREFLEEPMRSLVHDVVHDVCADTQWSSDAWFDAG